MTGRERVRLALSTLGVRGAGQSVDGNDLSDGMLILNEMIRTWRSQKGLTLSGWSRLPFTFTANQQNRTLGPGGQFDTGVLLRPQHVDTYHYLNVGSTTATPGDVVTRTIWDEIPDHTQTGTVPTHMLYEAGAGPLGVCSFWPIPLTAATAVLAFRTPIGNLTAGDDTELGDEYDKAVRLNLAIALAPLWRVKALPLGVEEGARETLEGLQAQHMALEEYAVGENAYTGTTRRFDITTYRR